MNYVPLPSMAQGSTYSNTRGEDVLLHHWILSQHGMMKRYVASSRQFVGSVKVSRLVIRRHWLKFNCKHKQCWVRRYRTATQIQFDEVETRWQRLSVTFHFIWFFTFSPHTLLFYFLLATICCFEKGRAIIIISQFTLENVF